MNSLGAGGQEEPYLVNAANALTFCLMVLSCFFSSVVVRYIGIKATLIVGTLGYAPYAAGLYTNNRFGTEWLVLVGAALCGLSAGIFWMAEAAIALAYPEEHNKGRFLGFWLSFRVGGQLVGGAINLGLNSKDNQKGKVSYTVYLIFIPLQACGPLAGLLLNRPKKVQRTDGREVKLGIGNSPWYEIKATAKLFVSRDYLLIVPLIAQAVYTEAVMFSFEALWFTVRARALGSFLSAAVAIIFSNILGAFLDNKRLALAKRARIAFVVVVVLRGAWFTWATVLTTRFNKTKPTYDWVDGTAFGNPFALFLIWIMDFQLNYLFLYFVVGNIAKDEAEIVRIAGLLRGTESASQAVSYGLNSIPVFAAVGGTYLNFGMWAVAIAPAWLVIRKIGKVNRGSAAADAGIGWRD